MTTSDHPAALDRILLVVRRDEHARARIARLGRVVGVRALVDRRRGERRTRDKGAGPIQTRRKERRRQTWVDAGLASVGAAFARIESSRAHTLHVTTEMIGGRWYGVLYHRGASPAALTVDEIANRLWVSTPCGDEAMARGLAASEMRRRESAAG
jgi:hypothetical protein